MKYWNTLLKLISLPLLGVVFLMGCAPSEATKGTIVAQALAETETFSSGINTAIAQTQESIPTATMSPSPIPSLTLIPITGNLIENLKYTEVITQESWFGDQGQESIPLSSAFSISINISGKGNFPSLSLQGVAQGEPLRRTTIYVFIDGNRIGLQFVDGKSDFSKVDKILPSSIKPGERFIIHFKDKNGKVIDVITSDGRLVVSYDLPSMSGFEMPEGLFPGSELFVGVLVSPHAELYVNELAIEVD